MREVLAVLLLGTWVLPSFTWAHALTHETGSGQAVVLRLQFQGTDERPWFEPYEIYAPGSKQPFQRGQVNAGGEIVFRPDAPGTWRVRVATEDGHGTDIRVDVDAAGQATFAPGVAPLWQRRLTGVATVFGLFGVLVLWRRQRLVRVP